MLTRPTALITLCLCLTFAARLVEAAEGMYPIEKLDALPWADMHAVGIGIDASQVRELTRAVVKLGGGTGAFVSSEGLVLTNHHIAFGCVVSNSSTGADLIETGYLAPGRGEELPCRGLELQLLRETRDVTAEVDRAEDAKLANDFERKQTRERRRDALADACQAGQSARRCSVVSQFGGARELLVAYDLLRDVRLVHVPERVLADFGGKTDNFEWPRHAADYALLRAYVAPNGEAATHAAANVPYRPLVWLTPTLAGYSGGDGVISIGFPGFTSRLTPAALLARQVQVFLPRGLARLERSVGVMHRAAAADPEVGIVIADAIASAENNIKRFRGQLEGIRSTDALAKRKAREAELKQFIASDPARKQKYGTLLAQLESAAKATERYDVIEQAFTTITSIRSVGWAYLIHEHAVEMALPEERRHNGFKQRQLAALRNRVVETAQRAVPAVDEQLLALALEDALGLPKDQRIAAVDDAVISIPGKPAVKAQTLAKRLIGGSQAAQREQRAQWWELSSEDLIRSGDPLILFVADLFAQRRPLQEQRERTVDATVAELQRRYGALLLEWDATRFLPDANGTLRVSWGQVDGFVPARGGSRRGFATTMASLIAAVTDHPDYSPSEAAMAQLTGIRLPAFVDPWLGDTPVNFLATTDTTGGNSGSPMLDGRGRLIGLDFDSNYESLGSSSEFDPSQDRSVAVDIRYVLDLLVRVYGAEDLLRELAIPGLIPDPTSAD